MTMETSRPCNGCPHPRRPRGQANRKSATPNPCSSLTMVARVGLAAIPDFASAERQNYTARRDRGGPVGGTMPEISRFFGILISINYNDHAPSHFHVRYGGWQAATRAPTWH